jgi:hypothetical protein
MPLTLTKPMQTGIRSNFRTPQVNNQSQTRIINLSNISKSSETVVLSENNTEIMIDTPDLQYFESATWTLNIVLPNDISYCKNVLVGMTHSAMSWPSGTSFLINFNKNNKTISSSISARRDGQFTQFIITEDSSGHISIHKHDYTALTVSN